MLIYYEILLGLSIFLAIVYAYMWHKHFDVNITMIFVLCPISLLAYVAQAKSENLEEAILANKFIYIAGCFTILFIMLTILDLCHLRVPRFVRAIFVSITLLLYLPVLTIGRYEIFYKNAEFVRSHGISTLGNKEYGFMHTVLYAWIFVLFFCCLISLIYSHIKKNDVSHKIIYLLFLPVLISMIAFFVGRRITEVELLPATYIIAEIFYLLIVFRLGLYNIDDSGLDSLLLKGETGFASFDFKMRYLGGNETAREALPMLKDLHVERVITEIPELQDNVVRWISAFRYKEETGKIPEDIVDEIHGEDGEDLHFHVKSTDANRTFRVEVNYLYDGRKKRGYQLFITDDTADVKYMEFQEKFNTVLRDSVDQKTERIRQMNDHLLISMAMLVESRDPFTGGHIRRTSEGVRLLIQEMKKDPSIRVSEKFCSLVAKAAPMHDIGKIAIPDDILLFTGRYSEEQYAIMKSHSAEGAKVLWKILKNVDEKDFLKVTVNVAKYHHERWDGKGYPEGLSGEAIPLEARIMAIADVYDALVSKRVYKSKMPPEKANAIILEGMGTQFDPGLQKYYEAARPALEAYYAAQLEEDHTQVEEAPEQQ
ncbi:MAG: HD domain-containing protein [Clostridiales bacterium]|nr:HD domain-containing protein [Clostridiales bacterium]